MRELGRMKLRDCVKWQLHKLCKSIKEIVARLETRYDRFILRQQPAYKSSESHKNQHHEYLALVTSCWSHYFKMEHVPVTL